MRCVSGLSNPIACNYLQDSIIRRHSDRVHCSGCRFREVRLLVIRDSLLKEIRLALEGDHVHKIEGIGGLVVLVVPEGNQKPIGDEFDVLAHQKGIHTDESD